MRMVLPGVLGPLLATAIAGCGGSAVPLAQTPEGGVMGLDGDHDEAMADARRQMSEACGGATAPSWASARCSPPSCTGG